MSPRSFRAALAALAVLTAVFATAATVEAANEPSVEVSPDEDLDPAGETVTITGSDFDTSDDNGIYVMFCARADGDIGTEDGRPDPDEDCNGQSDGKGAWIGHGPPADPVWDGDGFELELEAEAEFGDVDCLDPDTECGFFTQADHTGFDFFDNDTFTPVTFEDSDDGSGGEADGDENGDEDGDENGDEDEGENGDEDSDVTLEVTPTDDVVDGATLEVSGSGYADGQGIYVQFCAAPEGEIGTEDGRPDSLECNPDQDGDHTVWISPVDDDGTFETPLVVDAVFENEDGDEVDCREDESCGVFTRRDHEGGASDHSQDAFVAISFGDDDAEEAEDTTGSITADRTSDLDPEGDTISVSGEGFRAEEEYGITVCAAEGDDCDYDSAVEVMTSEDGTFEVDLDVRAEFADVDCTDDSCEVNTWAVSMSDAGDEAVLPIDFASPGSDTGRNIAIAAGVLAVIAAITGTIVWRRRAA